jgi:two-component system, chemotaxis family, protein-glutamate methylesterase/glutaminase
VIRLLIVDDSALMRRHLAELFKAEGDFTIEFARTGAEAVTQVTAFQPDVVTLDINMPEMDGLTALSLIMTARPTPVVMVSSLTEKGALATLEALALGAVDFIAKPGGTISLSLEKVSADLIAKVRAAARSRIRTSRGLHVRQRVMNQTTDEAVRRPVASSVASRAGAVLIGVSTGGPRTLEEILPELPQDFPWPILVAQHMPPNFTAAFSERMARICALRVVEAARPMELERGVIYIGKGGTDMTIVKRGSKLMVAPKPEDPDHLWHPSVELLVETAMQAIPPQSLVGVMLTGMGHDGSKAMTELRRRGGRTVAESEETAVVFGMPQELIAAGGADEVRRSDEIAAQIRRWVR